MKQESCVLLRNSLRGNLIMTAPLNLPSYVNDWRTSDGPLTIEKVYIHKGVLIVKNYIRGDKIEELTAVKVKSVAGKEGLFYANPRYFIQALPGTSSAYFLKQARRAQKLWNSNLAKWLGSSQRKRQIKKEIPYLRILKFTGVLQLNGSYPGPKTWPDAKAC